MSGTEVTLVLGGCTLSTLDCEACEQYLSWLAKGDVAPEGTAGLRWALAHSDEGVTWGRYDSGARVWRLGDQVVPEVSPSIRREALQELRIFGESAEVLIWRTDKGLRGRVIKDAPHTSDSPRPLDETRLLRGSYVVKPCEHGFTHISDQAGAEQVVPLEVTNERLPAAPVLLQVRHYYESDADTGAVRIAATRLVTLTSGDGHGA